MTTARTFSLIALTLLLAGVLTGCGDDTLTPTAVTVPTVTLDGTPPAIPTGVMAATTGTMVKIRWEPNVTDPDLAGYLVYRLVGLRRVLVGMDFLLPYVCVVLLLYCSYCHCGLQKNDQI